MNLFPIQISVEDPMVGEVLRILNSLPGIAKINLNLDGLPKKKMGKLGVGQPPPSSPPPGTAKTASSERPKAAEIIVGALLGGPKKTSDITHLLHQTGHHGKSAAPNTLTLLRSRGITESAGQGSHKLTDEAMRKLRKQGAVPTNVLALPAPEKTAKKKAAKKHLQARAPKTTAPKTTAPPKTRAKTRAAAGTKAGGIDLVLAYMKKAKIPVARTELRDHLVSHGFSSGSIDNFAHVLRNKKSIHSPEPGLYALLEPTAITTPQGE